MITAQQNSDLKPLAIVAGGAGFLGSFLCEALLLQDCRVICLDNLTTGRKENLNRCLKNRDFTFIKKDLKIDLEDNLKGQKIDYIFDLVGERVVSEKLASLAKISGSKMLITFWRSSPEKTQEMFSLFPNVNLRLVNVTDSLSITDAIYGLVKAMFSLETSGKTIQLLGSQKQSKLDWRPKTSPQASPKRKISQKLKIKNFVFLGVIILMLSLLPLIQLFSKAIWGYVNLKKAQQNLLAGNFSQAALSAGKSQEIWRGLGKQKKVFELGQNLAKILWQTSRAAENASLLVNYVFQSGTEDIDKSLSETKTALDGLYFYLSLIEAESKNPIFIAQIPSILGLRQEAADLVKRLPKLRTQVAQARKGMSILPWVIGISEKRTFLILLQNNHELRPTGGFIGSFALVTLEKGGLMDFEVQDVYWADGQLKGHIEPPEELKKYLGEANWYLRDSNWEPDFPVSAKKAAWFLEKETGRVVDGVIGVDLMLAQRLLSAVGEVELPDYQEKINADNLFERAEYYAEIGFFPGSTQKQDFLASLSRVLFEKLKTSQSKQQLKIGQAVYQSLISKDLIIYFNPSSVQSVISDLNWDGRIQEISCLATESSCLTDYLMIVEANLGVNKANYFVKRDLDHQVEIDSEGVVKETLRIDYHNDSPSEKFPGGVYKNYLRILVPESSQLGKVMIDNQEVDWQQIDKSITGNKTVFGFLVEVGVKGEKQVEITYQLGEKLMPAEKNQYLFYLQKQPGTKEEYINFKLTLPAGMTAMSVKPEAVFENNSYLFQSPFNQDLVFEATLVR